MPSHPSCSVCNGTYKPEDDNSTPFGVVVRAEETSVALPYYRHMDAKDVLRGPSVARFRLLNDPAARCGKTRPCITVGAPGGKEDSPPWICLMTTLDKTRPDLLPTIHRNFAIPIFPNLGDPKIHSQHIHTYPEWTETSAWVILIPMMPKAINAISRWRSYPHPGDFRLLQKAQFAKWCERRVKLFDSQITVGSHASRYMGELLRSAHHAGEEDDHSPRKRTRHQQRSTSYYKL
ncbi:hypothetical protein DFH06DRAFT_1383892 [Mycena polygramma]|nr:hypothetical protein DFH06DRAFT_1383892 [Mycena polygramma]